MGLFFLLRQHIAALSRVVIDVEYPGNEAKIKEHVINLLRRAGYGVQADQIEFQLIGKKSTAHVLALNTCRGERAPSLVLHEADILAQFRS